MNAADAIVTLVFDFFENSQFDNTHVKELFADNLMVAWDTYPPRRN